MPEKFGKWNTTFFRVSSGSPKWPKWQKSATVCYDFICHSHHNYDYDYYYDYDFILITIVIRQVLWQVLLSPLWHPRNPKLRETILNSRQNDNKLFFTIQHWMSNEGFSFINSLGNSLNVAICSGFNTNYKLQIIKWRFLNYHHSRKQPECSNMLLYALVSLPRVVPGDF